MSTVFFMCSVAWYCFLFWLKKTAWQLRAEWLLYLLPFWVKKIAVLQYLFKTVIYLLKEQFRDAIIIATAEQYNLKGKREILHLPANTPFFSFISFYLSLNWNFGCFYYGTHEEKDMHWSITLVYKFWSSHSISC